MNRTRLDGIEFKHHRIDKVEVEGLPVRYLVDAVDDTDWTLNYDDGTENLDEAIELAKTYDEEAEHTLDAY